MLIFKLIHTLVILKQNNLRSKFDKKFKVKKFVKGQSISKCPFGVFKSPPKKNCKDFYPSPNQKNKALYMYHQFDDFILTRYLKLLL